MTTTPKNHDSIFLLVPQVSLIAEAPDGDILGEHLQARPAAGSIGTPPLRTAPPASMLASLCPTAARRSNGHNPYVPSSARRRTWSAAAAPGPAHCRTAPHLLNGPSSARLSTPDHPRPPPTLPLWGMPHLQAASSRASGARPASSVLWRSTPLARERVSRAARRGANVHTLPTGPCAPRVPAEARPRAAPSCFGWAVAAPATAAPSAIHLAAGAAGRSVLTGALPPRLSAGLDIRQADLDHRH
jgi:hypothetical protein